MPVKCYSIEGNIGSGKSTFLQFLKLNTDNNKFIFVQEPVDEWDTIKDKDGTILEHFYKNKKEYSFSFQMMAYISRLAQIKKIIEDNNEKNDIIILMERCVYTDRNVFAKMLYDTNEINEINYQIYNKWFDYFMEDIKIDGIIYIKTDPEIAYSRVIKRGRKGEKIPLDYLTTCSNYHNNWILNNESNMNYLVLNGNNENNENKLYFTWLDDINNFFIKNKITNINYDYNTLKWLTGC